MSEWLQALPAFLVVVGLVLLPGLGMAYAVGLRGLLAGGAAPALGMTVLASSPVATQLLGLSWGPDLLLAWVAGWVLLAVGVGLLLRRWRPVPRTAEPRRTAVLSVAGVGLGVLAVLTAVLPAIRTPGELVDSTDAVAHLNRIRSLLDSGNFSSLADSFYPSGFHDVAGTSMQVLSHLDIVEATNLTALTAAAVIWPLGCVSLARHVLGRSPVVLLGAGLASAAVTTFPFMLLGWGVLWPNLLATAMLPGVLAPALVATRTVRPTPGTSRPVAGVATALAVPGLTLSHPNGLVSLVLFLVLVLMTTAVNNAVRTRGRTRIGELTRLAMLVVGVGAVLVLLPRISRQVADTASYVWVDSAALGPALREVTLLSLQVDQPAWGLGIVLLLGAVACALRRSRRWIVVVYAACVTLYVLAATSHTPVGVLLTGYWYNDKVRFAALAAVPVVLLAVASIQLLAQGLHRALAAITPPPRPGARGDRLLPASVTAAALTAFLFLSIGLSHDATSGLTLRYYHPPEPDRVLITAQEDADLRKLAARIPPGVVTAGVPANGSAFLYAFHDRPVLFDSLLLNPDPDSAVIALHLKEVLGNTAVCDALRRKNVQYAVTGPVRYWLSLSSRTTGLAALGGTPGFEEVGRAGRYRLYRIRACGFGWEPVPER